MHLFIQQSATKGEKNGKLMCKKKNNDNNHHNRFTLLLISACDLANESLIISNYSCYTLQWLCLSANPPLCHCSRFFCFLFFVFAFVTHHFIGHMQHISVNSFHLNTFLQFRIAHTLFFIVGNYRRLIHHIRFANHVFQNLLLHKLHNFCFSFFYSSFALVSRNSLLFFAIAH